MTEAVVLDLDLNHHCIATEVKRRYNRALSRLLKGGGDVKRLEAEVELLKQALETLDFPAIRSRYPDLAGQSGASVVLGRNREGLFVTVGGMDTPLVYR